MTVKQNPPSLLLRIVAGSKVTGLTGSSQVTVVAVKWYGNAVLEVTYRDDKGQLASQLLYPEDEARLAVADGSLPWSFDGDANALRLVSEAYRIQLAHLFDPYLAVHISAIEPLPHQISAVYQEMLPRLPLRYLLADDPGAGKTIMTGLFLKELLLRGDLKRCLIVTPGNLAEQWQDELFRKFDLRFELLTNDRIESALSGNVFQEADLCIARLDKLSRNEDIQAKLRLTDWDLVVCDEAHKMSATLWGGEVKYTKRFQLGRLLSSITRHFLLLTATPHNGKEEDFQLFMSLIDPDRFEGVARSGSNTVDVSDVMRRLVKEELLKFDGTPLFPERRAYTVNYDLSPHEAALYGAVTDYVQAEFNRADKLNNERKTTVGFALTILQRRLASSPEAIWQSLRRRRERLENRLSEERLGKRALEYTLPTDDEYDDDDLTASEREEAEEKVADQASAASTISELEAEIRTLNKLERMAMDVRASGTDRKWDELSGLLQDQPEMQSGGVREKLIIFTEHRDTLRYLAAKIRSLLGSDEAVVIIHGALLRDERRKTEELFQQDPAVRVLVATDAAGEGINLQRAHLMVNYDLPWNPNRLEQRFGRIHRIGQTEVCHLWNLVAKETREGMVFQRLFEKLEQEREALGGKVFDILGKVTFDNRPLRELLLEAVRYGNDPAVRARLYEVVDHALDRSALQKLLADHALTEDTLGLTQVMHIREDMERMAARKLQPHFIESFFIEAFAGLGGTMRQREKGRYEITSVPNAVRNRDRQLFRREPVLSRYERICFDKAYAHAPGLALAALVAPGHGLLDATLDLVRERFADVLKRGAIFIDDNDFCQNVRLLFYIEVAIQDGTDLGLGQRIVSKRVHFVEISSDGATSHAGYAPYLDYRAAHAAELDAVRAFLPSQAWLTGSVEDIALGFAVSQIVPAYVAEVRAQRTRLIDKTIKAVKERLTAEIQYWDYRAADLKQKEAAGKTNAKLNSQLAARRAEELATRLSRRLDELASAKRISALPPLVVGGALVVPSGLLATLLGQSSDTALPDAQTRAAIERRAMQEVLDIEKSLGYLPRDTSHAKCGYDIESLVPRERRSADTSPLRFIEVKGRVTGASTVTVTKNEILTALNKPEEYILAIVEIDGAKASTVYLKRPFQERPDFAATSVNYDLADLMRSAEIILKRG
ncbi:MAG: RNA polymerase-associated protein RapA [Firmicutes bacterium]|nr:RNA polymerase-associated protein RapA [Bacillota bacterium]